MSSGTLLDTLVVKITGDNAGLRKAFDQVAKDSRAMARNVELPMARVGTSFSRAAAAAGGMVAPLAAAAAGIGAIALVVKSINDADELQKMADGLGMTVEQLQAMQYAGAQAGASAEDIGKALRTMSGKLSEAKDATSDASIALRRYGINAQELLRLGPDEAFYRIVDAIGAIQNPMERAAAAQDLFGMSAKNLGSVIKEGSGSFRTMASSAASAGAVLTQIEVTKLKAAGDEMGKAAAAAETMAARVAANVLAEPIAVAAKQMSELSRTTKEDEQALATMGDAALMALGAVQYLWDGLKAALGTLGFIFAQAAAGISGLVTAIEAGGRFIIGNLGNLWEIIKAGSEVAWNTVALGFAKLVQMANKGIYSIKEAFGEMLVSIGTGMQKLPDMFGGEAGNKVAQFGRDIANNAADAMAKVSDVVAATEGKLLDAADRMKNAKAAFATTGTSWGEALGDSVTRSFTEWSQNMAYRFLADAKTGAGSFLGVYEDAFSRVFRLRDEVRANMANADKKPDGGAAGGGGDSGAGAASAAALEAFKKLREEMEKLGPAARIAAAAALTPVAEAADAAVRAEQEALGKRLQIIRDFEKEQGAITAESAAARAQAEQIAADNILKIRSDAFDKAMQTVRGYHEQTTLERLAQMEADAKAEQEAYENKRAVLAMRAATNQADHAAALAAIEALDAQHAQNTATTEQSTFDLKVQLAAQGASIVGGILGQAAALMDKNNKKQFYAWKVFATGQAIINAFLAFSNVLASASAMGMPAPVAFALAGTAGALGLAAAAKIAATPFGGSAAGGMTAAGAGGAGDAGQPQQAQQAAPQTTVNVGLYGSTFSADQVRGLIGAINEQAGDNMTLKAQVAA